MICEKPNNTEAIDINNLPPPEPLSKRVVRGGIWVFALRITNRGLGFIWTIILGRLLALHDLGLLGIAMVSKATLETFSQAKNQVGIYFHKVGVKIEDYEFGMKVAASENLVWALL